MGITLGGYSFDEAVVSVEERLKERGGRDARIVLLKGVLEGYATVAALEAELDAIAAAASESEAVSLSLRPGRVLHVLRTGLVRRVYRDAVTAAFELHLEAADAVEQAEEESAAGGVWNETQPTLNVSASGNTHALPRIALSPDTDAVRPSVGVGERVLTYDGVVPGGSTLVVDAAAGLVLLDGDDVTPYTQGLPPLLLPGINTVSYADESPVHPELTVAIAFRARWW